MLWSPGRPGRWRPPDGDSLPLLRLARPWGSHSPLVSPAPDRSCQTDTPPHVDPSSPHPLQCWGWKVGNVPGPGYLAAESPTPGAGERALVCPIPKEEACLYGAELGECCMSTLRISWTNFVGPPWELSRCDCHFMWPEHFCVFSCMFISHIWHVYMYMYIGASWTNILTLYQPMMANAVIVSHKPLWIWCYTSDMVSASLSNI